MSNDILILGIESSCDETSASVVKNGRGILSNVIYSQIDIHTKYGGVVPEIASRNHVSTIDHVVSESLNQAGVTLDHIDAVATTYGPGLVGALLVGLSFGKALAYSANKPLIGVHHIEGHICACYLENDIVKPPFMCLVVSGGHTQLVYVSDYTSYEIIGKTRDDAAGEAFDKVARAIGLPYPGGVKLDILAKTGNPNSITFPRAMKNENHFDFSFSGIKSAVLNYINTWKMTNTSYFDANEEHVICANDWQRECANDWHVLRANIAASFQSSVVDILTTKAIAACKIKNAETLVIAGGVAANSELRLKMKSACDKEGIHFFVPAPVYCTDNAAMIASCGYYSFINGESFGLDLNAYPNLPINTKNNLI